MSAVQDRFRPSRSAAGEGAAAAARVECGCP
jgi:hypothetical protein